MIIKPNPISRLLIFGGNGFVGQAVAKAGLSAGLEVIGLSRRGSPEDMMHGLLEHPNYSDKMKWEKADISSKNLSNQPWTNLIDHTCAVVSCVGMFSTSNEEMKQINGDANAALVSISSEKGALRFVYLSAFEVENELPIKLLPGYFQGKRLAEEAVAEFFPNKRGVILQPGMVSGERIHKGYKIPLNFIGKPLSILWELPGLILLRKLPGMGKLLFSPPVDVHSVAKTVVLGAQGLLPEQYVSDEVCGPLNDENEHNDNYRGHQEAIKLSIEDILRND